MKYFSIIEPSTKEAIQLFAEKRNLLHVIEKYTHPQEDFLMTSETPPIFVVSDGVTLNFTKLVEKNIEYPNPSPAGDVAKTFCEGIINHAKEKYETFSEKDILDLFKYGNTEVRKYNETVGKTDIGGNDTGYYSATGSFLIIKNTKAYWASICDSFIAHFDKDMNLKFMSSGLCRPYAVINGEERMADYLQSGIFNLETNDRLFIFTDGFEQYMKNPDFLKLLKEWGQDIKKDILKFSMEANLTDPEKYGHERSIIGVLFD